MLPIVDTHQHLWDLSRFELPWTEGDSLMSRNYLTADYLQATKEAEVVKAVYMEVDVAPHQKVDEANYIINVCRDQDTPTCAAVISRDPSLDGFSQFIQQFKDVPEIKGLRQVLHGPDHPRGYCLTDSFVSGMELLGQSGLSFDLCLRPNELSDGADLARRCPGTTFILDHCGNADPYIVAGSDPGNDSSDPFFHTRSGWMADIESLAELSNVYCKISGIVARAKPGWTPADLAPTVDHCLNSFGPDRVIFGGDWPVCTYGATYLEWASALRNIIAERARDEQKKLLHDNAIALYGLA